MSGNEKSRGFSGLKGLTSNFDDDSKNLEATTINTAQTEDIKNDVYPLLSLKDWPTLPAPWSSVDPGETWVWGDFFLTFQKRPKTTSDLAIEMAGERSRFKDLMIYHYAISVFYRYDRNPHGPSRRPIMVVALEQSDKNSFEKMAGIQDLQQPPSEENMGPIFFGMFFNDKHYNFGEYVDLLSPQTVKQKFFDTISVYLRLTGQPKFIGTLQQAFGHPETGLPSHNNESANKQKRSKTLFIWLKPLIILTVLLAFVFAALISFFHKNKENYLSATSNSDSRYQGNFSPSSKPASPNLNYVPSVTNNSFSSPQNISGQTTANSMDANSSVQYVKPPVGTNNVLSVPQICYCIREDIKLDAMRDHIANNNVDAFNDLVNDYNERCSKFVYNNNDLDYARQMVEAQRIQIEARAIAEAATLGRETISVQSKDIKEIQTLLYNLGYNPGPIDGLLGGKTYEAIKKFQDDNRITNEGGVDGVLDILRFYYYNNDSIDNSNSSTKDTINNNAVLLSQLLTQTNESVNNTNKDKVVLINKNSEIIPKININDNLINWPIYLIDINDNNDPIFIIITGTYQQGYSVEILRSDSSFITLFKLDNEERYKDIIFFDIDSDGNYEVLVRFSNGAGGRNDSSYIIDNNSNKTFSMFHVGNFCESKILGDLNNDGFYELSGTTLFYSSSFGSMRDIIEVPHLLNWTGNKIINVSDRFPDYYKWQCSILESEIKNTPFSERSKNALNVVKEIREYFGLREGS